LFFREKKCEIIIPCATLSDLSQLLNLDVDGFYFGIKGWSRSERELEFSLSYISELIEKIHQKHKKALLSFNLMPGPLELHQAYLMLQEAIIKGVDGVICSDPAIAVKIKESFGSVEVHASLGALIISKEEARFWADLGVDRVVLSPHLSLEEVEEISKEMERKNVVTEIMICGIKCRATLLGICRLSSYFDLNVENVGLRSLIWMGSSKRSGVCFRPCAQEWKDNYAKEWQWAPILYCDVELAPFFLNAGVGAFKIGGRGAKVEKIIALVNALREKMKQEESYV